VTGPAARPRVEWRAVDGLLLLDKPAGLSSNRALQRARRLYRAAKGGHTGSLDPFATGVLPLCFGQATKVAALLLDAPKAYRARLALGRRTATGDLEGEVVESRPVPALDASGVRAVLGRFVGEIDQVPPMYSALKRDGEALYALARRGVEVERPARPVTVHALELEGLEADALEFSVRCSKGTYVRTLGEDLARALGTCGHLAALRRVGVAGFLERAAHRLEALEALAGDEAALDALLLPIDAALEHLPKVALESGLSSRFRHGAPVPAPDGAPAEGTVRVYGAAGALLGLGVVDPRTRLLAPQRLLSAAEPVDSQDR